MAGENFIALENTSQEIKTAVAGVDTAVDGIAQTATEIKEATDGITLSEASIKAVADEILAKIGLTNDSGGGTAEGSIFAKLNALLTQIASAGGGIKRVQRGKVDKKDQNNPSVNITLDYSVDVNKTFVLAFGLGASNQGDPNEKDYSYFPCATLENANTIQVKGGTSWRSSNGSDVYDIYVAWQVIEFY